MIVSVLWGGLLAWDGRYFMNPDGVSYIDIATETLRSGPHNLINGYWSPLYPALIAALMAILRPSGAALYPAVHLLNWLIFFGTCLAFLYFLRAWLATYRKTTMEPGERQRGPVLVPFAFALFLYSTVELITIKTVTPDLCVAAIVFLAAGICWRLAEEHATAARHAALGAVLALGYYAKSAMLPAGLILLAVLLVFPPSRGLKRRGILLAAAVFLLLSAPLVAMTSRRLGHFGISATGTLNYAWYVNGVPKFAGWIGGPGAYGAPKHPPRVLSSNPLTLEFASPAPGTFPLWYEPSYWYEGVKPSFDLKQQIRIASENFQQLLTGVLDMSSMLAGLLVLGFAVPSARSRPRLPRQFWWAMWWPLGISAMYALVHVEYRFVGPLFAVLFLAAYLPVLGRAPASIERAVLAMAVLGLLLPVLYRSGAKPLMRLNGAPDADGLVIAERLHALGLDPGDSIGIAGNAFEANFARVAGLRIVALIQDSKSLPALTSTEFGNLKSRLAEIGVKALIAAEIPANAPGGWQAIPGTRFNQYSVALLQNR